jgi:transposase-like protein
MATKPLPKTLVEAVRYFADPANCDAFMVAMRWPNGVACPRCGSKEVTFLANARVWKCRANHKAQKFSAKVGTVMEDSPIALSKWLPCIWLIVNCKNGVSSYEIHRALGVTQKTAWFMLQRIRLAMQDKHDGGKLGGYGRKTVEVDETFIGARARMMNSQQRKHRDESKAHSPYVTPRAIVLGMLERKGRVRLKVVPNVQRTTLAPHLSENIAPGSEVHTDEWKAYDGMVPPRYFHDMVNHTETYVRGNVHINGIENFWSLLKRTIRGTYVSVEPFHLFRYLDEQAFRFNERQHEDGDRGRFMIALRQIVGRRVMYKELIGMARAAVRPS